VNERKHLETNAVTSLLPPVTVIQVIVLRRTMFGFGVTIIGVSFSTAEITTVVGQVSRSTNAPACVCSCVYSCLLLSSTVAYDNWLSLCFRRFVFQVVVLSSSSFGFHRHIARNPFPSPPTSVETKIMRSVRYYTTTV